MRRKVALITLALILNVFAFQSLSIAQGDNWWYTCANQVWTGYCGDVEQCCQAKFAQCMLAVNPYNGDLQERLGKERACRNQYNDQCVSGALLCYDDPI